MPGNPDSSLRELHLSQRIVIWLALIQVQVGCTAQQGHEVVVVPSLMRVLAAQRLRLQLMYLSAQHSLRLIFAPLYFTSAPPGATIPVDWVARLHFI